MKMAFRGKVFSEPEDRRRGLILVCRAALARAYGACRDEMRNIHFFNRLELPYVGKDFDTSNGERILANPEFPECVRNVDAPVWEKAFIAESMEKLRSQGKTYDEILKECNWCWYFKDLAETVQKVETKIKQSLKESLFTNIPYCQPKYWHEGDEDNPYDPRSQREQYWFWEYEKRFFNPDEVDFNALDGRDEVAKADVRRHGDSKEETIVYWYIVRMMRKEHPEVGELDWVSYLDKK